MRKEIVKYNAIMIFSLFCIGQSSIAANNELVRMDLDQMSNGSVKVNIYTDKPYQEQVIVNKKPDNKYVILLPETSNSMNIKPEISGISGIKNVDVKSQQYSSIPNKGYTKITIDSKYPLEVIPQTHVTKPVKKAVTSSSATRPSLTPQQVQMTLPQRVINPQRPVTNNDFVPAYERQREQNEQGQIYRNQYQTSSRQATPTYIRRENNTVTAPQRTVQQPVSQFVSNQTSNQQTVTQNQPIQQVVSETNDSNALTQNEQVALEDNADSNQAVDGATREQLNASDEDITEDELAFFKKIIKFKQKVARKIKKLLSVRISFATFMTVLQFILLIVLIKVIGDLLSKVQNSVSVSSQPVTRRLIHDNDETFEQAYPSYSNMDVYNTNRSNFEEDNKEGFNVKPLSTPSNYQSRVNNLYAVEKSTLNNQNTYDRNNFYRPISELSQEEKMSIFDENAEDIEKTIFKNPLTPISKQAEETLFDEEDISSQNTPFADSDVYNIKEEEFFGYNSNQKDEDFFIFEDDDEDEEISYVEDYQEDEDEEEYEYIEVEEDDYDEEEEFDENFDDDDIDESVEETLEEKEVQPEPVNPFDHLNVLSKYVIDSTRGFAHVDVDGINALIGYVGSKITVIRKFTEDVNDKMQVRLNEQPDAVTMIYIIKLGKYKTLVEVRPDRIRQLLDL